MARHLSAIWGILCNKFLTFFHSAVVEEIVIYDDITPYPKLNIFKRHRLRKTSFRRRRR